jgi:hypothetical protein
MALKPDEVDALVRLAQRERRRPKDQAAKIVVDHLKEEGPLDDTATALVNLVDDVVSLAASLEVTPKQIGDMITKEAEVISASYDRARDRIKNDGMSEEEAFNLHFEEMQCWRRDNTLRTIFGWEMRRRANATTQ